MDNHYIGALLYIFMDLEICKQHKYYTDYRNTADQERLEDTKQLIDPGWLKTLHESCKEK